MGEREREREGREREREREGERSMITSAREVMNALVGGRDKR